MALTDTYKHKIVRFLGYSAKSIIVGSTEFKSALNSALNDLDAVSEASAVALVDRIEDLDERLVGAIDRLSAKKVDDITLRDDELQQLRGERHRLTKELGRLLDIRPMSTGGVGANIAICV